MIKDFVLDTSILLHSPYAMISGFDDNNIILTGTTLQELDKKKIAEGEAGYNARESIRILDSLREKGNLVKGVATENGGKLFVVPEGVDQKLLPNGFNISVPDNQILSTCLWLNKIKHRNIILVTNDVSMRVNASILGLRVEVYKNEQVESTEYTGHSFLNVSQKEIDYIYKNNKMDVGDQFIENEFVTLKNGKQTALSIHKAGVLYRIKEQRSFCNVKPLNLMQSYALYALRAPASEIPLVILSGMAGTAKTFLSLAAGMEFTKTSTNKDARYTKIFLSRPNGIGFSNIGFLPGNLEDKLSPLMASYYDNMEILLSLDGKLSRTEIQTKIDEYLEDGVVELCSLDFIRGRSLQYTYIICDEAQNASRGLIRDVVTRVGKGSKCIIAGDPNQIDVPSLDERTNGLVYCGASMQNSPLACLVTFDAEYSVRSPLSKDALERMKF